MLFALAALALSADSARAQSSCASPANEIVAENCLDGTPPSEWDVAGAGDPTIQGFATDISVNQGQTVHFKVDTDASAYELDIYRMGWYGGDGARLVTTVLPPAPPDNQEDCEDDPETGLIDCGNWTESASWTVPPDAVTGIYFARLVRADSGGASHIPFIVRDDDGRSDLLFQTSDTTWQAYNRYGGNSLYTGGPGTNPGRAYKVSYNRPFTTRDYAPEDSVFNAEYPMVRWLERNGYDVSYFTGVDTDRFATELREHRVFLSVGHDEYWGGAQRANVEAARNAGVNLAFFSGNEVFWKTRWENSIAGPLTARRTLVSYKETHAGTKIDPAPGVWTGTWRDPRPFNPEGGRPENALTGTIFMVNDGPNSTIPLQVPAAEGRLRLWRNAGIPTSGTATLADDTVGYEWDEDLDNGARPPGLIRLSATTAFGVPRLIDFGSNYAPGTATHRLTLYRAPSGALVFGAGTVQWSWGLDDEHDRGGSTPSVPMQQATVNLLADMLVQPASLQTDLARAAASTDRTPPTSAITRVTPAGSSATVQGTAVDTGGGRVGGVEVSLDGGATWHPATGRESWTYTGILRGQVRSRAVDDSGNLEGRPVGGGGIGGAPSPPVVVPSPPVDPGPPTDRRAPRVRIRPKRVRASRRGVVRLRATCPRDERRCRVDLRLRRAGRTVARTKFQVSGGRTRHLALRLNRSTRRRLARAGSLRVTARAAARDVAANRATTTTRIRVLAPKKGMS